MITRTDPVLDRLRTLHPKLIDLTLDRVYRLLRRLNDPHMRLPPVIHVAGTNGKGSTVAFLRAMLEAAGQRVHVYTSPHLVRFHERIRLAGTLIDDDHLAALLERCELANAGEPITFFEITTCAALLAFAEVPADAVLLEVGLGGRLDATNVVPHPAVTAITRISFDHMQFLGGTLTAIASEKAGIMRRGVPCIIGPQATGSAGAEVMAAFRAAAAATGARLAVHGEQWWAEPTDGGMRYRTADRSISLPRPALPGAHQIGNAGTAIAALGASTLPMSDAAIAAGLAAVDWPARLQRLTHGPLVPILPAGWELWLDGGHNDSAGEVLAAQAAAWSAAWGRDGGLPLDLVFGMLANRDPADMLRPLAPFVARLRTVAIPGEPGSLSAQDAAEGARRAGVRDVAAAADVAAALSDLVSDAPPLPPQRRVLICGSLYLAGQVLAQLATGRPIP